MKNMNRPKKIDAVAEWRSMLSGVGAGLLLYGVLSGLLVYILPFGEFAQFNVLIHTLLGLVTLVPVGWFLIRHMVARVGGNLSHYQVTGYVALALLVVALASGLVLTWQGLFATAISYAWSVAHLFTGLLLGVLLVLHLGVVLARRVPREQKVELRRAIRSYGVVVVVATVAGFGLTAAWYADYSTPRLYGAFDESYNWKFGENRPYAPSLARVDRREWLKGLEVRLSQLLGPENRVQLASYLSQAGYAGMRVLDGLSEEIGRYNLEPEVLEQAQTEIDEIGKRMRQQGAVSTRALAGSEQCGSSGCHEEIYREWLPSAHRYSSMDELFQRVQTIMVEETSPEHTRYCAGCHDPISLFAGAKTSADITLSSEGENEGTSCLICHSVVQADIQGNGDYTIRPPRRYLFELDSGMAAKRISDYLIRTYPEHHLRSYSRSLYKTSEFCAACHKQYLDKEVNVDIGKVQGQNQYDAWKNSRWYHGDDDPKTIQCRECHMPLVDDSRDPARGDPTDHNRNREDRKHRSHRTLAANQYIPKLQALEGWQEHVRLTDSWLRGDFPIPEIADNWTDGPVVRMELIAPQEVVAGEEVKMQVLLVNNKTGHDFPTGPLDMLESWVELTVRDNEGRLITQLGGLDALGTVSEPPLWYKADGYDRKGELIDRHNLWDLVGASYKRSIYPGMTDSAPVVFRCPSMSRDRVTAGDGKQTPGTREQELVFETPGESAELVVTARLLYRKVNSEFLLRVYGDDHQMNVPVTELNRVEKRIKVVEDPSESRLKPGGVAALLVE